MPRSAPEPAFCHACGQEWPRDPRLEVACPTCHVGVGARCKRPSGHRVFTGSQPHLERDEAAIVAGFLTRECPKNPRVIAQPGLFDAA